MRHAVLGIATLVAATLAAPAFAQLPLAPKSGGILQFAVVAEPPTNDCHATVTFATLHPVRPHYSGLLRIVGDVNVKLELVGDLAKSWSISPDGLTYTFKLHEGVKFHDGTILSSEDVKASYQRIINPPEGIVSPRKGLHQDIVGIETPDATTVVFKLKSPNASMANNFASPFNCIYSAKKLTADPKYPEKEPMGTGGFVFGEYVKGSYWTAKRFDGYFMPGKPHLAGYKAYFVKSAGLVPGIQGGQFDAEFRVRTPVERDQLVAAMGDKVTVTEGPWTAALIMTINTRKKPFDDVRVRQALTHAIDRWGGSVPLSKISSSKYVGGYTRPGSDFALSNAELEKLPGYARDMTKAREEAKKLLAAAGVTGLKIKFVNRNIGEPYTPLGVYVVDQWRRIGVEAEHSQLETRAYFDATKSGSFDVIMDFISDFIDDPSLHFVKFISAARSPVNLSGHTDPKLDDLFDRQAKTLDLAERRKLTQDFERHAITQAHSAMLLWGNRIIVNNRKVKGWQHHASHFTGTELLDVWLDE